MPFVAPELHGQLSLIAFVTWSGDPADGPAALAPIRAVATPLADLLGPMPYAGMYRLTEQGELPVPSFIKSAFLPSLDGPLSDEIVGHMEQATSPCAFAQIRVLGGALADVPADATAFAHRDALAQVKAAWDPTNVFALNQNVKPATAG